MEIFEKLLKELAFSKSEIAVLLDETKADEHAEVIKKWDSRYSSVIAEKVEPELKAKIKEDLEKEDFNKGKESIRKTRKAISSDLSLGLTNKQIEELTDAEFSALIKEHANKETSTKLTDLEAQYKEEKRLREEAENKLETEINKVKADFEQKDIQREIQLRKARLLASKDSTKFDNSDMELIDYAIEGAILKQGVSFVIEDGKVFVVKDGQKIRNSANEFVEYDNFIDGIITPKFEIKTRATPDVKLDEQGKPIVVPEKSEAQKRLEQTYKHKGVDITV